MGWWKMRPTRTGRICFDGSRHADPCFDEGSGPRRNRGAAKAHHLSPLNFGIGGSDSDVVPVVRVNPQYPIRAAEQGVEGWVELEFTITASGTVKDPVVVAAKPARIFDVEALRAIGKWRYNPKIVDGKPVERSGVRVRLRFRLEN